MAIKSDHTTGNKERFDGWTEVRKNGQAAPTPKAATTAELLHGIYLAGMNHYAVAWGNKDNYGFTPIEESATTTEVEDHLSGDKSLGGYTLRKDSTVTWLCWDVDYDETKQGKDSRKSNAQNITEELIASMPGCSLVVEDTGNAGYHIWAFLTEPVSAERVKKFGYSVIEARGLPTTGDPHVEFYPKQTTLTDKTPFGNLVKLPLGRHLKSNRFSFFCRAGEWDKPLEDVNTLLQQRVKFEDLEKSLQEVSPISRLTLLLSPYWSDRQRHNLALPLSGLLCNLGWSLEDTRELITALTEECGGDLKNLLQCADDTFAKAVEGKEIQGFSGLSGILPVNTINALLSVAGQNTASPIIATLDRIRLKKTPQLVKAREVSIAAMAYLNERGRFVRTPKPEEHLYWFEHTTHLLVDTESAEWMRYLHRMGLNEKEAFSAQVIHDLWVKGWDLASVGKIYQKFHWDGYRLWVNFGGPEVYVLDGENVTLTYNGESHVLFDNAFPHENFTGVDLLQLPKRSPWELLTDDLNFAKKESVTQAEAEQQKHMLRAYILAACFPELHPTKPICIALGDRGSGKSTAERRIVRFFNGMIEDVLFLAEDKQDSLRASLQDRLIMALDNLEGCRAKWLPTILSQLATGGVIELRRLHKTNERFVLVPKAAVMISAVAMPSIFSAGEDEAVASRLLPVWMEALGKHRSEQFMQQVFSDALPNMWAGMLDILNQCVACLNAHASERGREGSIRLADYENFCYRLRSLPKHVLDYEKVAEGIKNLSANQQAVMSETSPLVQVLQKWIDDYNAVLIHADNEVDLQEFNTATVWQNTLKPIAERIGLGKQWRWSNGVGLSHHLEAMKEILAQNYGFEVRTVPSGEGKGKTRNEYKIKQMRG